MKSSSILFATQSVNRKDLGKLTAIIFKVSSNLLLKTNLLITLFHSAYFLRI